MIIEDKEYLKRGTYGVDKLLVDTDGVILKHIYENDKVTVETPKDIQSEEYKKYKDMIDDRNELSQIIADTFGSFYFNFFNGGLNSMGIKESIKLRFLLLCTYSGYNDKGSYICYENGRKMGKGAILDILNLSEREGNRTIKELIDSGLLVKEDEYYIVNTDVAIRGKLTSANKKKNSTRIFDLGLRELYKSCDPKQHKQLYYLFKMLPYINRKFNVVCQNPDEIINEEVIPLTLTEICQLVGYNVSNVSRFKKEMYQLKVGNQYAMLGVECAKGMWYKINPKFSYGGYTTDHLAELNNLLSTDFSIKVK